MGDLIVMSHAKTRPAREGLAGHSAEILFFTGVRYYRMEEAELPAVPQRAIVKRRLSLQKRGAAKLIRKSKREALA